MKKVVAETPPVTIVIPCFNHGAYLPEALASVANQTYPHTSCVVVDDGSTDPATQQLLADLSDPNRRPALAARLGRPLPADLRVISQPNRGLAAARNAGVRVNYAPFFVPLDADDVLAPDFVAKLLPVLRGGPRLGYAYCAVRLFGARSGFWRCPPYDPYRLLLGNLSAATALVRREAFDAVGGYAEDMVHGYEDWDFWIALLARGWHGARLPNVLFHYRQHAAGESMLGRLAPHRERLIRRMITRHRPLFARLLGLGDADEATIFAEWQAAVTLDSIERATSWRLLRPWHRPWTATAAERVPPVRPSVRLAAVQHSRAYRLVAAAKRTRLLRWYARRRYGRG